MKPVTAVIAQGQMGAGVGRRLGDNGIEVKTLLAGRSAESHARAVLIGRPMLWGLTVRGADGVEEVLAHLRADLVRALILCGAGTLDAVTPDLVT